MGAGGAFDAGEGEAAHGFEIVGLDLGEGWAGGTAEVINAGEGDGPVGGVDGEPETGPESGVGGEAALAGFVFHAFQTGEEAGVGGDGGEGGVEAGIAAVAKDELVKDEAGGVGSVGEVILHQCVEQGVGPGRVRGAEAGQGVVESGVVAELAMGAGEQTEGLGRGRVFGGPASG